MNRVLRANMYFLTIILLQISAPYLIGPILYKLNITDIYYQNLIVHFLLLVLPAIIYLLITKSKIKETLKLNRLYVKDAIMVFLLTLTTIPLTGLLGLIGQLFFPNRVGNLLASSDISVAIFSMFVTVVLMPPISEEINMRGIILDGYNRKGILYASLISGLLFGVLHLDGQQFLYAAALGFIMAMLVRITNTIFSAALFHFIINGRSLLMLWALEKITNDPSSGITKDVMETAASLPSSQDIINSIQALIIPTIIFTIFTIGIFKVLIKWNSNRRGEKIVVFQNNKLNYIMGIENKEEPYIKSERDSFKNYIPLFIAIIIWFIRLI